MDELHRKEPRPLRVARGSRCRRIPSGVALCEARPSMTMDGRAFLSPSVASTGRPPGSHPAEAGPAGRRRPIRGATARPPRPRHHPNCGRAGDWPPVRRLPRGSHSRCEYAPPMVVLFANSRQGSAAPEICIPCARPVRLPSTVAGKRRCAPIERANGCDPDTFSVTFRDETCKTRRGLSLRPQYRPSPPPTLPGRPARRRTSGSSRATAPPPSAVARGRAPPPPPSAGGGSVRRSTR